MIRDLNQFQSEDYELIIVGGGIYGAAICWEAASRGLKVALFEKSDFGSATSANSLKIIHGGFRYLQQGDIPRLKESVREQRILMHIAPHLVHPMPVLVPIYGHGLRGKETFSIGLRLFNIISSPEDQLVDPEKQIPLGRIISKDACFEQLPSIKQEGLSGGGVFFDGQVYNSERLVLSFLHSAWQNGAHVANYTEVVGFVNKDQQIKGVKIKDVFDGDTFEVTSRLVLLACGPWNEKILSSSVGKKTLTPAGYAKAINLITRKLFDKYAVGIRGQNTYHNGKYIPNTKDSYLFVTPWKEYSIIGTAYTEYDKSPDEIEVNEDDISFFLKEFNRVYPAGKLSRSDIFFAHWGLLPLSSKNGGGRRLNLSKKFKIVNHRNSGYDGLISIDGVKYTTARYVAQKTVDYVLRNWDYQYVPSTTAKTRLYGGEIGCFNDYLGEAIKNIKGDLSEEQIKGLIYNYGSAYPQVLEYIQGSSSENEDWNRDYRLLDAQIRFAVANEMAKTLGDVVFRRTELGSGGNPGDASLAFSAQVMARELNWSQDRIDNELEEVRKVYNLFIPAITDHDRS
jgi:glycerol-3-phosphate dehydrogenase